MTLKLQDGSRIGIVGGGPAGSLFSYFLLTLAQRMDLRLQVDIYEPRDFARPGPGGCNMCGGIVSESLIQALAVEGILLPGRVVQRGLDSYVLHSDNSEVRIETPLHEMRIAAIHRGGGPKGARRGRWGGLDGYLLGLAEELGARVVRSRVRDAGRENDRPTLRVDGARQAYDLVVGATGVNSSRWRLLEQLGLRSRPPRTTKAFITEIDLGEEVISRHFGTSIHLFLLSVPGLDCAAVIPKGEFLTVCLLGERIDDALVQRFFDNAAVRRCFAALPGPLVQACRCKPNINVREAERPYADRVVLIGDCGATRLYKDGIGAAYRAAKCAARTAVLEGISAAAFQRYYMPLYRSMVRDNRYGSVMFGSLHWIKRMSPLVGGVLQMAGQEQTHPGAARDMSIVLWDTFTGSAPYRDIVLRALRPRFIRRFAWETLTSMRSRARRAAVKESSDHGIGTIGS
jgi:flavin-dependent dehydrogenase